MIKQILYNCEADCTVLIRKPQVISGGVRTPCTLPLDPPLYKIWCYCCVGIEMFSLSTGVVCVSHQRRHGIYTELINEVADLIFLGGPYGTILFFRRSSKRD